MEKLYNLVNELNITLEYEDLKRYSPGLWGLYVLDQAIGHLILLDEQLLSPARYRLHRCVLAEEIGHALHPPRPGHLRYYRRPWRVVDNQAIIVAQDEAKALRWATDFLMPDVEFRRAQAKGYDTVPDLADYFYVTEEFVRAKIGFLRRKARDIGRKLKWSIQKG